MKFFGTDKMRNYNLEPRIPIDRRTLTAANLNFGHSNVEERLRVQASSIHKYGVLLPAKSKKERTV